MATKTLDAVAAAATFALVSYRNYTIQFLLVSYLICSAGARVLKKLVPETGTLALTVAYFCSTAGKITSPATPYVRHQNAVAFHPGVHEKRTLMNFERACKHSLITQFAIHVDTNIGLAVYIP